MKSKLPKLPDVFPAELAAHVARPPSELRSKQRPRDPAKRCYELAGRYFLDHWETDGVALVHGFVALHIVAGSMMHAWVTLPGDLVYDRGRFFHGAGYRGVMQPEAVKSWTSATARECFGAMHDAGAGWAPCADLEAEERRRIERLSAEPDET